MKLELDPTDLKPEYQEKVDDRNIDQAISTMEVNFDKLNAEAQAAVLLARKATFFSWDRQTYNAIYPPK